MDLDTARERERAKYVLLLKQLPPYGSSFHGKPFMRRVSDLQPSVVVDLGCGHNDFCKSLRSVLPLGTCYGVDFANAEADLLAPIHRVPLPDSCADVVTSFDVLEHLLPEDVPFVLSEVSRLLMDGGHFFFTICTRPSRVRPGLHPTVQPAWWWKRQILDRIGPVKIELRRGGVWAEGTKRG